LEAGSQNRFSEASLCSENSLVTQGSKTLLRAGEYRPAPDNVMTSLTIEVKIQVQDQTATVVGDWPGRSDLAVVLSVPGWSLCLPGAGLRSTSGPRSIRRNAELPLKQGPLQ